MIDKKSEEAGLIEWRRINMRNVDDMLGVEFVHDLYNRHDPKINSIRFRHTKTVWKNGILNSYAPISEWDRLGELLGQQYYQLDSAVVEYTKNLYKIKRKAFHSFMKRLKKIQFSQLPNDNLASLLINFQSIVLGELYVLNFVQVEHGLNVAIRKIVNEISLDENSRERLLVDLMHTDKSTASHKERIFLCLLAKKWSFLNRIGLYREEMAKIDVTKHYDKYKYLYTAYGEQPRDFPVFWDIFIDYMQNGKKLEFKFTLPQLLSGKTMKILKKLKNEKLNILVPLLVMGGIFRDTNKSLLGPSIKYRFAILDEISRRGLENRDNARFYLLSELVDLLKYSKKLGASEIFARKEKGIIITRSEDFSILDEKTVPIAKVVLGCKNLNGQCASLGISEGECKIVLTKEQINKVKEGDVMVAVGTDFNLIEAMYRSSAVITEEGGILSHAAIVCRELGKPCCIGVKDATKILVDGMRVRVDASHGQVIILE